MPRRLQRSRRRGWRKPDGAVIVDRTSRWGNPVRLSIYLSAGFSDSAARRQAVLAFGSALRHGLLPFSVEDVKRELRGKDLVCFCPLDKPCHANVLLAVANGRAR